MLHQDTVLNDGRLHALFPRPYKEPFIFLHGRLRCREAGLYLFRISGRSLGERCAIFSAMRIIWGDEYPDFSDSADNPPLYLNFWKRLGNTLSERKPHFILLR